ncbi:MAG: hypothetical protein ABSC10_06480 [Candidatus Acidiferrales bacterium]|jgi:hypothetical protein
MALILRFSFAAQVIAAFVIFVLGYIGLFATLMLALVVVRFLYEGVKWLNARAAAKRPVVIPFPQSVSNQSQSERRIPTSGTQLINESARVPLTFQPALHRRRATQISR